MCIRDRSIGKGASWWPRERVGGPGSELVAPIGRAPLPLWCCPALVVDHTLASTPARVDGRTGTPSRPRARLSASARAHRCVTRAQLSLREENREISQQLSDSPAIKSDEVVHYIAGSERPQIARGGVAAARMHRSVLDCTGAHGRGDKEWWKAGAWRVARGK
eukprot:3574556-Prymnesium_polylepis.2